MKRKKRKKWEVEEGREKGGVGSRGGGRERTKAEEDEKMERRQTWRRKCLGLE